jgi:hypothetical protein
MPYNSLGALLRWSPSRRWAPPFILARFAQKLCNKEQKFSFEEATIEAMVHRLK